MSHVRAERLHNQSKFRFGALLKLAAQGVLAHSSLPLRIAFYVGLATAGGAAVLAAFHLLLAILYPGSIPQGFTTTQILILFGIGLNSLFLGVIGVYVGRIYDQVRLRPATVISDAVNFDDPIEKIEVEVNMRLRAG